MNCLKCKAHDHYLETVATRVMVEDESDVLLATAADGRSDWILNLDKKVFSTYVTCEGFVWMTNNTANRVVGKGTVRFRMTDKRFLTFTEVRHVPSLRKNLIFIGMLDSKVFNFATSGEILRVFKGSKKMLRGKKTRRLY